LNGLRILLESTIDHGCTSELPHKCYDGSCRA